MNFDNKKILIIIPHQDDEINVASIILKNIKNPQLVYVVYTTNGDFLINEKVRYKEAIRALNVFGIKKDNIYFLGYSDQPYDQNSHMYNTNNNWISNNNKSQTSGANGINEYCYKKNKYHNAFNKENMKNDIKSIILELKCDIIVGIDLDFHPDHIMTSLLMEKAIGEILKMNINYAPLVLKTFAYENSYLGPKDLNNRILSDMYFQYDEERLKNNPYYDNENEINIIDYKYKELLIGNKIYKSIKQHKSQFLVSHAEQMINPNCKYWIRNTKNLIRNCKIFVSSGNPEYLNDFLLCDSNNILHGNTKAIKWNIGFWEPDKNDNKRTIEIKLNDYQYVEQIRIYFARDYKYNCNINVRIDNKENVIYNDNLICKVNVQKKCTTLSLSFDTLNIKISEIEILSSLDKYINDNVYHKKNKYIYIFINKIILFIDKIFCKFHRKILYIINKS